MPEPVDDSRHSVRDELAGVLTFLGIIWLMFIVSRFVPLLHFALVPRTLRGIPGIVLMPLLHASWEHLMANTVPLFFLLTLLAGSRSRTSGIVGGIIVVSGALLWLFGRSGTRLVVQAHVGASGLVFGLITFLIAAGLLERRVVPLLISLLVGFLYGGTLLSGVVPFQQGISWDGHLWGAVAGVLVALVSARRPQTERHGLVAT